MEDDNLRSLTGSSPSAAAEPHAADDGNDLFKLLVANVRDYAIFMLDPAGHVATWNAGAERIKGYRAPEIVGRHFSTFYPEDEARTGRCEEKLEVAGRDGRFEDEGWRVRKDGTRFWANVVISAIRDDRGALLGFAKVTRDLTERVRHEEDRAARRAAEQANRTKDEFLAMLGHELRNPLAPIVTALQLMKVRGDTRSAREQQVIERQVTHMLHLVDDLVDVSKIAQGKIELKKQQGDLRDAVARAIEIASPLIEQRGHRFEVTVPPHEIAVLADDARLTQIITNLLTNAAKYTAPKGLVELSVREAGRAVIIEVRDDGIGIDAALLPRVFDLFVQGYETPDRAGGLGLGLTLVRTLVELHGGTVEARSAGIGQGSTFTVTLPIVCDPREEAMADSAPVFRPSTRPQRVLIVDDNDDARLLLADILAAIGHTVESVGDPEEALGVARRFLPDVAILDIGLPGMDGYELAARLRASLGDHTPRLIALTGFGQPNDLERSARAGFDLHLLKPVDVQQLIKSIASR